MIRSFSKDPGKPPAAWARLRGGSPRLAHKGAEFPGRGRLCRGAPQPTGRSVAPGSACRSLAARPLCWWLGEVSHPKLEPSERLSAKRPGNGEGGNPVPGRLGGGERSAGRGGAREAEIPLLVDGVAGSAGPKRTGVQRGKTCGKNLLQRERKAGEKEAGRDLKCLRDERSRCSPRSQRPTGDDRGQEDTASEGTRTRRFTGSPQAAAGIFSQGNPQNKKGSGLRSLEPPLPPGPEQQGGGRQRAPVARLVRGTFLPFLAAARVAAFGVGFGFFSFSRIC
ncbi:hypothetical protein HPG69_016213 [Diceros bicornis minor]|uniref:Uncharacterized protein n=1 Tax=Diceros bicornis minor TaxID=77932 RepID=A0A7J7FIS6_DICBM|nr:hypothetical protein HPG69_016213 [Diceros bicornis minor]